MEKHPDIKDPDFYKKINKIYKNYKITEPKNESIDEYCKPKKFRLQEPQLFLSNFIIPKSPYKSILIYHRIGAGKTCSAIQIAEKWKNKKKIVFVLPASLIGNFKNELRSLCGGEEYLKKNERLELSKLEPSNEKYKKIIETSNERIENVYNIYSYNKFVELIQNKKIKLTNTILFVDEIQNMVSEKGSYYKELSELIEKSKSDTRIVLLSATPMFDKPSEIALTMNLLKPDKKFPVGREFSDMFIKKSSDKFSMTNVDKFKKMIKGYISYYNGAPSYTFPHMTVKYVECEMSDFQYEMYKKLLGKKKFEPSKLTKKIITNAEDLPNNFYLGARFVSNIVYPNKKIGDDGMLSFTKDKILDDLDKYSCKMYSMINKIISRRGKTFIYSGFKGNAGLDAIAKVLDAYGYKNYNNFGTGPKTYAIWSGDSSMKNKDEIRDVFNRDDNLYGNKLKIILGSPSIKEGVSLKAVQYVHVLEPYWNKSRLDQVIGRASRFCSHLLLPPEKRNVKVYVYVAISKDKKTTIDQYIKKLSETKNNLIKQFEKAIKEAAVDCFLNKEANDNTSDEIKCVS
jgi:hypothetical protein